jgi:hypothetical protein
MEPQSYHTLQGVFPENEINSIISEANDLYDSYQGLSDENTNVSKKKITEE